jgi:hypothetical protein
MFLDNVFLEDEVPVIKKEKKGNVLVHYNSNFLDLNITGNFKFEEPEQEEEIKVIYIEPKKRKGRK